MKDGGNELTHPVVEDWPGRGNSIVGYGSIGGLLWDDQGEPVVARQNHARRLVNRETHPLNQPVQPQHAFTGSGSFGVNNTALIMDSLGTGGLPEDIVYAGAFETINMTAPTIIDPLVGQRIYEVDPTYGSFAYADDNYVFLIANDTVLRTINLGSPVLQVDKAGLIRTRRGIATVDGYGGVEYLKDGSFMHASSKGDSGEEVLATSTGGTIMLFDVETNERKWKQTMARGSMSRWSRVFGLENPATIMWCNRYEMALIDLREKPKPRQKAVPILEYADRSMEIRAVDAGFRRGNDIFAVTTTDLLWISATPSKPMHPVLSEKHMYSNEDASLSLYRGSYDNNELLTVCSQLAPVTSVGCFSRTKENSLPVSARDVYFVDAWPTIISQSHITVEDSQGVAKYTVGRDGGLFKQLWTASDNDRDGLGADLPPPDELTAPQDIPVSELEKASSHKDYDLLDIYRADPPFQFHWLYCWAFKPLEELLEKQEESMDLSESGAESNIEEDSLRHQLEQAWLDPLQEKSENHDVHPQTLRSRQGVIDMILADRRRAAMASATKESSAAELDTHDVEDLALPSSFKDMLKEWNTTDEPENVYGELETMSQPTQLPDSSQTQGTQTMGFTGSFSQPSPTVPSLKVSKKQKDHKKAKKKRKLHR